jgi:antitoxin (DNA-binding transcriptional repressor) of toxin-antitoxin stability system
VIGVEAMASMNLTKVNGNLPAVIAKMQPGEELLIEDQGAPVAKLVRAQRTTWPCQPGSAKHLPHWMAPDFNAPLEDFGEYM